MNKLAWALWAVVGLATQACMVRPENGDSLPSASTETRFSGFWATPEATIELQSATAPSGPFTTFATATSRDTPIVVGGTRWFRWGTDAEVPTRAGTGCAAEAFVRARAHGFNLITFDSASVSASGQSGVECLREALADGTSLFAAVFSCMSSQSPVVRLKAGGTTFKGDVTIATQSEADAVACFTKIHGSLTIADDPAALAIALPNLREVTGDVSIVYSREVTGSFMPAVRSVSLPALTEIGGSLSLTYPGQSSDLVTFDLGLESLANVGGDVTIAIAAFNATLSGLDTLATIPGSLSIESTGSDFTLFGLLPALMHVSGDVAVRNGLTLLGALEALESIGGSLRVEDSFFNPGTSNFESLAMVAGDVELIDLSGFITVAGFDHQLAALASVGGELAIVAANGFTDLLVGNAAGLAIGALRLDDNGGLTALGPVHITVATTGPIAITDNANLCQATAQAFVDAQTAAGWSGTATLTGNAVCP